MNICVAGIWHLGEIYSACLAELGNNVLAVDEDREVIANLKLKKPPLEELGLRRLIAENIKKGKLKFTDTYDVIGDVDIFWVTIDTPVDSNDYANTKPIFKCVEKALPHFKNNILIVISSQLPAGTSKKIINLIKKKRNKLKFGYAYVPENLQLGEAVESFMKPSRIVVGTDDDKYKATLSKVFEKFNKEMLFMNVISAEMVKHATNSFLATSLSFIYDISDICESVGADVTDVARALRADERIGLKAYLDSSAGFSGGTLARDLRYLMKEAKLYKLKIPVIGSVFRKNNLRRKIIYRKIKNKLGKFGGKTISFFGLTYKAGTSTLRRSLPLIVAKDVLRFGALVKFHDRFVNLDSLTKEMRNKNIDLYTDPYEAASDASAIICITPSEEMRKIDFKKLSKKMTGPKIFFDARNYFINESNSMNKAGLCYIGVGR